MSQENMTTKNSADFEICPVQKSLHHLCIAFGFVALKEKKRKKILFKGFTKRLIEL